jgi:hypothetical protein
MCHFPLGGAKHNFEFTDSPRIAQTKFFKQQSNSLPLFSLLCDFRRATRSDSSDSQLNLAARPRRSELNSRNKT